MCNHLTLHNRRNYMSNLSTVIENDMGGGTQMLGWVLRQWKPS